MGYAKLHIVFLSFTVTALIEKVTAAAYPYQANPYQAYTYASQNPAVPPYSYATLYQQPSPYYFGGALPPVAEEKESQSPVEKFVTKHGMDIVKIVADTTLGVSRSFAEARAHQAHKNGFLGKVKVKCVAVPGVKIDEKRPACVEARIPPIGRSKESQSSASKMNVGSRWSDFSDSRDGESDDSESAIHSNTLKRNNSQDRYSSSIGRNLRYDRSRSDSSNQPGRSLFK